MCRVLSLFHNEITNSRKVIEMINEMPKLKELSIDGNPVSAKVQLKYEITVNAKNLVSLDDEPIQELDRDIAEQYCI